MWRRKPVCSLASFFFLLSSKPICDQDFKREAFLLICWMGLSSFPSAAADGVLPVLVMSTVLSVALLKNMMRSVLQVMGANWSPPYYEHDSTDGFQQAINGNSRERRISITQFKSLCHNNYSGNTTTGSKGTGCWGSNNKVECCVCLCGFEAEEEVSELSCKHFFHKGCLDKWFNNKHSTCPVCRSIH